MKKKNRKPPNFQFKIKCPSDELDENDREIFQFLQKDGKDIVFIGNKTNAHGGEVYESAAIGAKETATINMPYHPDVTSESLIVSYPDNTVYEIIGTPDNIQMQSKFLEFKIKRYENGR